MPCPKGGTLTIATANEVIKMTGAVRPGRRSTPATTRSSASATPASACRRIPSHKVFEPFFTTKPIGQGTGLGLSMIYGFAKQSRGHVRVDSTEGQGTTFRLYLPGTRAASNEVGCAGARRGHRDRARPCWSSRTIQRCALIISDVLRDLGYASIEAGDGQAALPMLTSNTPLDLLITDVGLPGLNGRQFAEIARQHRPDLKILFVTGYAEHATGHAPFLAPGMEMVTKPFALDSLALKIREMLGK